MINNSEIRNTKSGLQVLLLAPPEGDESGQSCQLSFQKGFHSGIVQFLNLNLIELVCSDEKKMVQNLKLLHLQISKFYDLAFVGHIDTFLLIHIS